MKTSNSKYVIGNWKMEPKTAIDAEVIFSEIQSKISRIKSTKVVICPPSIFIGDTLSVRRGAKMLFGAQDVFWEKSGSFTGEISIDQLKDSDVSYVIVGHSERRALGESNKVIARKLQVVIDAGMTPVLCIGETDRDGGGEYLGFIKDEIESSLLNIPHNKIKNVIIAYEPVWAIGKGAEAINAHEMHQMSIYIRKILVNIFGKKLAGSVPVLYGGSVNRDNAETLIKEGDVNGFLVGRASLDSGHFSDIVSIVEKS